jgi:hypothetical protein
MSLAHDPQRIAPFDSSRRLSGHPISHSRTNILNSAM